MYVPDGSGSGDEVVEEVCRDPDHGGEGDAEAHALGPPGVLVVVVGHRRVRDYVVREHALCASEEIKIQELIG